MLGEVLQARFAIKFFLDKRAFAMEQHIQSLDSLKLAISAPEIILANTGGGICSPDGVYTFPSLTVTEEGEPLEAWLRGSNPAADYITCVQVRLAYSNGWLFLGKIIKAL